MINILKVQKYEKKLVTSEKKCFSVIFIRAAYRRQALSVAPDGSLG
jgi:hypothetical protein